MPKLVKYVAIGLLTLIALMIVGAGIIAATFDPNDYKPMIINLVQEKKQRTLAIPGDIKLTFFPRLGADLGKVRISEHKSTAEFASVDSVRVSLQLIPLLSKRLVVDHIRIDGLNANIKRFKDGTTNFDDLISEDNSQQQQIAFDVGGISMTDATLHFVDQQQRRKVDISGLDLETGKIASGAPSKMSLNAHIQSSNPAAAAQVAINSGFMIDFDKKHYVFNGADARIIGRLAGFTDTEIKLSGDADLLPDEKRFSLNDLKFDLSGKRAGQPVNAKLDIPELMVTDAKVSGGKLRGDAKLIDGARAMTAAFSASSFEGSPSAFKIPSITLDIGIKEGELEAKANIAGALAGDIDKLLLTSPQMKLALSGKQSGTAFDGTMTSPVSANLKSQAVELAKINAAFTLPNPGGGVLKLAADGRASADLDKQTMSASFKGKLDESAFDAKLGMRKFSPAAYTFDVALDQLDVDRYRTPAPAQTRKESSPEKPIDLSGLRGLRATGSVRIGALKAENIQASNVRLDLRAVDGKVDINPLTANLYGGTTAGAISIAAADPARFMVRQNMVGVDVGALLKDAIDKRPIEGRGNIALDVTAAGNTFTQLKRNLDGNARLELRDGAIRGVNVAQTVRGAKAKIGALKGNEAPQTGTGSTAEKTDFSELTGSFRIANGVAHNNDLDVKSPLIRATGSGTIDLGQERVDYLVKATIVSTLKGQGGPDLEALKGLTVPVRLSGPFDTIGWRIDFAGLASELAKQKIDEKKEEVKTRVQDRLKQELESLFKR